MNFFLKLLVVIFSVFVWFLVTCGWILLSWYSIESTLHSINPKFYNWYITETISGIMSIFIAFVVFYRMANYAFYNKESVSWKEILHHPTLIGTLKLSGIILVLWFFWMFVGRIFLYSSMTEYVRYLVLFLSVVFFFLLYRFVLKKK